MLRKWIAVAVLAVAWGQPTTASAQYLPMPVGQTRLPDPLPMKPSLGPNGKPVKDPGFVQGPISPEAAPRGPADELALPASHTNANQAENFVEANHLYIHAGALYLQRQRLGHQVYVYRDFTPGADIRGDQNQLPENLQVIVPVLDPDDIVPSFNFGVIGTIGYLGEGWAIEANGFYIPKNSDEKDAISEQGLNAFFTAPPQLAAQAGLIDTGTAMVPNDFFLQGDVARIKLTTELGSAELCFRYFPKSETSIEPLLGVRYVNFTERFTFRFDDEGISSLNAVGASDVTSAVLVESRVANHFVGPQLGFENQLSICQGITLGLICKSAVGVDRTLIDYTVATVGNTFSRIHQRTRRDLAFVHEANLYFDTYYMERLRLRAGYRALMLQNFLESVDQIDFDLSREHGRNDNTGNIFFHGASLELQILF